MSSIIRRALRLPIAVFALVLAASSCHTVTDSNALTLCHLGVASGPFGGDENGIHVEVGETREIWVDFVLEDCAESDLATMKPSGTSAAPATATIVLKVANSSLRYTVSDDGDRARAYAEFKVTGVSPGQTTATVSVVWPSGSAPAPFSFPVTVVGPPMGTVNVTILGLPAGASANVYVGSVLTTRFDYPTSASHPYPPGAYALVAQPVTFGGQTYNPSPSGGNYDVVNGQTTNITVTYTVSVATTGTANIQIGGLPTGATGSVQITGTGVNQTVTQSGNITLPNGNYTVTSNTVATTNNDYADPQPTRQVTISGGQITNILFAYVIIATLVNLNITGLEAGLFPMVNLTRSGSTTQAITTNAAAIKLAIGLWTIAMIDRTISIRTYQRTGASALTLNVLAQTTAMSLVLAYYCARFQWIASGTLSVFSDPNGHQQFINMLLVAHALSILWTFPDPAPQIRAGVASQVASETVTISGISPFVTVTGTRASNGSLNLTGSGTVAGNPNVPVLLTGILSSTGAISGGQYRMGQPTAPFGLPNGPITYNLTTPAAPAIVLPPVRAGGPKQK